ncbi:MAG TPA: hypothetical protein VKU41_30245 [Polyangiaceae bacterium]|nr:hypothetical protein [Polyangiaceae bacterium]
MRRPRSRARVLLAVAACGGCGGDQLVLGGGGTSDCLPGTYVGTYQCAAGTGGDGGFQAAGNGSIVMKLQGDRGGATLTIGPGSQFTGMQAPETWVASFSGSLDCASNKLTGTLGDVNFTLSGSKFVTLYQAGTVSADYDAGADADATPVLANGLITETTQLGAGVTGPVAACTWSATLQR